MASLPGFLANLRWIDISRPLGPATPVWPGERPVEMESARWTNEAGRAIEVGRLQLSLHAGTHLDAPRHMIPAGVPVGKYPLSGCLQPARVVDAGSSGTITLADVASLAGSEAVLFRTRPAPPPDEFCNDFPGIAPDAARRLAGCGLRLVGTDAPSVDPFNSTELPAHHILFGAGIFILENLRLDHIASGNYLLLVTPLPLAEAEASPVRPLLAPMSDSAELTGDR